MKNKVKSQSVMELKNYIEAIQSIGGELLVRDQGVFYKVVNIGGEDSLVYINFDQTQFPTHLPDNEVLPFCRNIVIKAVNDSKRRNY